VHDNKYDTIGCVGSLVEIVRVSFDEPDAPGGGQHVIVIANGPRDGPPDRGRPDTIENHEPALKEPDCARFKGPKPFAPTATEIELDVEKGDSETAGSTSAVMELGAGTDTRCVTVWHVSESEITGTDGSLTDTMNEAIDEPVEPGGGWHWSTMVADCPLLRVDPRGRPDTIENHDGIVMLVIMKVETLN